MANVKVEPDKADEILVVLIRDGEIITIPATDVTYKAKPGY